MTVGCHLNAALTWPSSHVSLTSYAGDSEVEEENATLICLPSLEDVVKERDTEGISIQKETVFEMERRHSGNVDGSSNEVKA